MMEIFNGIGIVLHCFFFVYDIHVAYLCCLIFVGPPGQPPRQGPPPGQGPPGMGGPPPGMVGGPPGGPRGPPPGMVSVVECLLSFCVLTEK